MRRPAIILATVLLAGVTGCGNNSQQDAPEPHPSDIIDGTHTQVIQMPDGFRNVAFTCYGHDGIYVTSRGAYQNGGQSATPLPSGVFVVPNDSHCP